MVIYLALILAMLGAVLLVFVIDEQVKKSPNTAFYRWWNKHVVTTYNGEDF